MSFFGVKFSQITFSSENNVLLQKNWENAYATLICSDVFFVNRCNLNKNGFYQVYFFAVVVFFTILHLICSNVQRANLSCHKKHLKLKFCRFLRLTTKKSIRSNLFFLKLPADTFLIHTIVSGYWPHIGKYL